MKHCGNKFEHPPTKLDENGAIGSSFQNGGIVFRRFTNF
jgi:hypothetical protein